MAIKAIPTTQRAAYASIPGLKAPAKPKPAPAVPGNGVTGYYTPGVGYGYSGATGKEGWAYPQAPVYIPPKAPVQTTPLNTGPTTPVPRSAVPGNYTASLADIEGNPLSQGALGAYNTQMQTLMNALKGNIGQAWIKSGYDPTSAFQSLVASRPDLGEFSNLLDPATTAAAAANPLSERAQADLAFNRGSSNLDYALAARGLSGSGAVATGINQLTQQKQLAQNVSEQNLMSAIQGGIGDYLNQKTTGYNRLQDVYSQVAQMLANQYGAVPETGTADLTDQENAGVVNEPGTNVPSAATRPTNYLDWGGQQIRSVAQMKQWLAGHGQNWNAWAARYPAAARQLVGLG